MGEILERFLLEGPYTFVLNERLLVPAADPYTVHTLGLLAIETHAEGGVNAFKADEIIHTLELPPVLMRLTVSRVWSGLDIFMGLRLEEIKTDGSPAEDFLDISVNEDIPREHALRVEVPQRAFPVSVYPLRTSDEMRRARKVITDDANDFFSRRRK